jgi:hypothetical protein
MKVVDFLGPKTWSFPGKKLSEFETTISAEEWSNGSGDTVDDFMKKSQVLSQKQTVAWPHWGMTR